MVAAPTGESYLVAAGGYIGESLRNSELLDLQAPDAWVSGPDLPYETFSTGSVQHGSTVALVGGFPFRATTLILDPETMSWSQLEGEELAVGREDHTAILVDEAIFPECS